MSVYPEISICQECGEEFTPPKAGRPALTVDHVVPISRGGSSNIDNLQPLCLKCNSSKNNKIIDYRVKVAD